MDRLYSGGCYGSDYVFTKIAMEHHHEVKIYSFPGHSLSLKNIDTAKITIVNLDQNKLEVGLAKIKSVSQKYKHSDLNTRNSYTKNLLSRNFYITKYVERVYAIGYLKEGLIDGGTAYGCYSYLENGGTELYFYDCNTNKWYLNLKNIVEKPPKPFGKYAGIGTRELPSEDIIRNLYED